MPLPLLWLGAGIAAAYAGSQIAREKQKSDGHIRHFPGEHQTEVTPVDGAIVCCGIYELFQHTGIWLDGNIVELRGNGLIRGISPSRFLSDRSGNRVFVACNEALEPLVAPDTVTNALDRLYTYSEYDLVSNNCHRFVYECVSGSSRRITRFAELNAALKVQFHTAIHWQPVRMPIN
ncbi:hypothetical protein [Alteromonas sp. H39]|uniref:hypothetical protein n=1 Tax=Alteromonas sp. H39 TaxID=3389876 RepID=UPI0039E0E6C1